ncbi:hypothetical protein INR49_007127 [Caranx melampygus]|nr:hypothetical protein INR49_007127 [Caranx melampygus]
MNNLNGNGGGGMGADGAGVWNMHQSSKKLKEVDQKLRFLQGHVKHDQQYKLMEVEDALVKRQNALCTKKDYWILRELEQDVLLKASALENVIPDIRSTLERILKQDRHCGSALSYLGTGNRRQNGKLMWEEVDKWKNILENSGKF